MSTHLGLKLDGNLPLEPKEAKGGMTKPKVSLSRDEHMPRLMALWRRPNFWNGNYLRRRLRALF